MSDLFGPGPGEPRLVRVIDFETTGDQEDPGAEIIELGRIDVDLTTRQVSNPWRSFASCSRLPIPPETKGIHHITEADIAGFPRALDLFGPCFEGCGPVDYLAAHNAGFEQHFHDGSGRKWIDTYKCALVVWPEAPSHKNQSLRYWLDLDNDPNLDFDRVLADPPHRALPDAYVTAHILVRLLDERSAEELAKISEYPALLRVMNFGKHKGMTFEEAPADYLEWIRDKSEMNSDTKFSAKYWLKKRGFGK
jgi:exodeoxyribonuclease X